MNRYALLIVLLTLSLCAIAQTNQAPQTVVLPGTGVPGAVAGPSTNTGTAVIIAPPSAPLLVTPEVHLTTVVPQVGASNATAGNNAGAANSTATMPVQPRVSTTVPQFSGTSATVTVTPPPVETSSAAPATTSPGFNAGVGAAGSTANAPVIVVGNAGTPNLLDRGVGSGVSIAARESSSGKSLGEIARENRQHESGAHARVYTNQDIDRINQQPGSQIGGISGTAVGAANDAGAQPQQPSTNLPAVSQPSANPPSNPGVSRPVPPSNTPHPNQSF